MVFLASMLSAFVVRTFYETGMIYAFIIGISAEILYLSYSYRIIKKSEKKVRDNYIKIIEAYKEREIAFEKQKFDQEKSILKLKKKNIEKEKLLEAQKMSAGNDKALIADKR